MPVLLYTTLGCHLCEQAREWVAMVDPEVSLQLIDIADDDALLARYGERIPVLAQEEKELAWPFGLLDVQQWLSR